VFFFFFWENLLFLLSRKRNTGCSFLLLARRSTAQVLK